MEEYIAISKNIKMSPRKVRLVADSVKKEKLPLAIAKLTVLNKRAALPIKKTLESALANAVNNFQKNKEELIIKNIIIGEGIAYKRFHFASRGRVHPYKRRTSHIRVILTDSKSGIINSKPEKTEQKEVKVEKPGKKETKKKEVKEASTK